CFPGGHVEEGESFVESVKREVLEETGLEIVAPMLCGVKQWTQRNGEYRYIVFFYKTNQFKGEIKDSKEGRVFWIDRKDLKNFTLADGFESMIEVFEREDLSENYHWFEDGVWKVENK
ncbi:MAG: NUDIX domain-containing protein, partial [Clostridia bacterium]|nr:NUDIX domain-containing protein [Clostridia bacterium]